jgi:hypothetical protein
MTRAPAEAARNIRNAAEQTNRSKVYNEPHRDKIPMGLNFFCRICVMGDTTVRQTFVKVLTQG